MKKALIGEKKYLYFYSGGKKVKGKNPFMNGLFFKRLTGDCTALKGDCSFIWGDCSGLEGDCTGVWGNCTGIKGNLDKCNLTKKDREAGVNIEDLIKEIEP